MENLGNMGEFPNRKILLNEFISFSITSVPSPSNSSFHLVTLYKFQTPGFMYTYVMVILINWYLLKVVFSIANALNGQRSPKQTFYSPHLLTLFRMCVCQEGGGEPKRPPTSNSFSPVTSANVGISPQNFLTFSFNPFTTLA